MRKILIAAGLILLWALIVAGAFLVEAVWFGHPTVERGNFASIENQLVQHLSIAAENKRLGSAALVLVQDGKIVAEHGFGVSNAETQAPVKTDQTLFQLGSVSKAVTAFGVMKLVEEGKINLDEPVMRYLKKWRFPGSEAHRDKVTVRHLLSHTGGLEDQSDIGVILPGEKMKTLEESLDASTVKVIIEPGTGMIYGNGSSAVLQLLIEDVTNRPFADYMKEAVLQPLGMTKSSFDPDALASEGREQDIAPNFDSSLNLQPRRRYTATGAVALYATGKDLARFALAFTGENPVLRQETLKQMLTPQPATNGTWGLGQTLYVENESGGYLAGHGGGAYPAWGAVMRVNPATRNGLVLIVSGAAGAVNHLPHDWVYWETGKMTTEAKRQVFYDRMKGLGLWAFVAGAILIGLWSLLRGRKNRKY